MDLLKVINAFFILFVAFSGGAVLAFWLSGLLLSKKIKSQMPVVFQELGRPLGVATILMRNTSLYDEFLKPGKHRCGVSIEIERLGKVVVLSKYLFHFFSTLCFILLILMLLLK